MPVNYNAFNVDPLRYQQAAMGNFRNAMALRDQRNQNQEMNAMRTQQQQDLQGQRQEENALAQQRVGEMQKRTDIYKSQFEANEKQYADEQELKWQKDATQAALTQATPELATQKYNEIYRSFSGKDPKTKISFTEVGPSTTAVIDTPQGKVQMTVRTHKLPALMDALNSPEVKANPKLATQMLADAGAQMQPFVPKEQKEPKEDTFTKKRMEGFANTLNDIDATLAKGSRVDESGVEVPLGDLERGRLMLAKHELQNQVRRSRGEKPIELFKSPEDVRGWFKAGLITKDEAKGEIAKKGWNIGEDKKASKKEEKKASSGDFSKEGADNPISKIINEFSLSSSNFFKDWNEKRRRAARRLSEEAEARKAAQK